MKFLKKSAVQRLTTNIGRIGGMERDFSPKAWEKLDHFLKNFPTGLREFQKLVDRNRIFMDRNHQCRWYKQLTWRWIMVSQVQT
jgi:NADH:ubiquinone oxidoreductase subunit D